MATNFRLVPHAAERHAHEVAAGGARTDLPSDVLPTPGGPTRHKIGPFIFFMRCWTARYSRMRSLTFSRPKWSALSTRSAPLMSV